MESKGESCYCLVVTEITCPWSQLQDIFRMASARRTETTPKRTCCCSSQPFYSQTSQLLPPSSPSHILNISSSLFLVFLLLSPPCGLVPAAVCLYGASPYPWGCGWCPKTCWISVLRLRGELICGHGLGKHLTHQATKEQRRSCFCHAALENST